MFILVIKIQKNRLPVYKSDKCYEKYLDLLLYEEHYMIIKNI